MFSFCFLLCRLVDGLLADIFRLGGCQLVMCCGAFLFSLILKIERIVFIKYFAYN